MGEAREALDWLYQAPKLIEGPKPERADPE
jgi:hypothetical protein